MKQVIATTALNNNNNNNNNNKWNDEPFSLASEFPKWTFGDLNARANDAVLNALL